MNANTRTILALALIFLVFIGFQYLTPKHKPTVQQTPDTARTAVATPAQPSAVPAQAVAIMPEKPDRTVPVRELVISGSGFSAKLSTLGATLSEYQLQNYLGPDKKPVQLIPQGERALAMEITAGGRTVDLAQTNFSVIESSDSAVVFETTVDGVTVRKRYSTLFKKPGLNLKVELFAPTTVIFGTAYTISWGCGLNSTEKDTKLDEREYAALAQTGKEYAVFKLAKLRRMDQDTITNGDIIFNGVRTKYFAAIIVPPYGKSTAERHTIVPGTNRIVSRLVLTESRPVSDSFKVYIGPIEHTAMAAVDPGLERVADTGWRWLQWISRGILWFLTALHRAVPNYGVVIIIFSALMKLVFFPLTYSGMKSMKRMQQLQPKLKKLQDQHKNDPGKLNQETMALYKKEGVNPFSGCLPLLIQMPIFFALYSVLANTIELRQAGFMLWLTDLSVKDPYYVLSILMGIAMFFQQKLTTVDPKQKMMVYIMPVMMAVIFASLPAGLNLYWLVNNILSIGEQYLIHVRTRPAPEG